MRRGPDAPARGLRRGHGFRHPGRAHSGALPRDREQWSTPRPDSTRAGCRLHGRRLRASDRKTGRLHADHRPGRDQLRHSPGPGLRRLRSHAARFQRKSQRVSRQGLGVSSRDHRSARGDGAAHRIQRHGSNAGGRSGAGRPGFHRVSFPATAPRFTYRFHSISSGFRSRAAGRHARRPKSRSRHRRRSTARQRCWRRQGGR